jgi:hypothetical protein
LHATALADLDAVAVDVEHEFEGIRVGEEADHVDVILEVGVERVRYDQVIPQLEELKRGDIGDVSSAAFP